MLSGTAYANSTVKIYDGATLLGTVTASASGAWSLTPTLTAGLHNITATATIGTNTSSPSSPLALTLDVVAPSTPPLVDLATASDSGSSSVDNITSVTSPVLNGTAEANATVKVYDGTTLIGMMAADASGNWTLTPTLAAGPHSVTVTATDLAGNTSASSSAVNLTVDTASPTAPSAPALTSTSDTGSSSSDNITSNVSPVLAGSAEANATVAVYDGAALLGTTTADAFGNWTLTSPTASSLNLESGSTVANLVTVTVGDNGMVSLYSFATTDLIADIAGYYEPVNGSSTAGRFVPVNPDRVLALSPERILDTRSGVGTTGGKPGATETVNLAVAGHAKVPLSGASTLVANVTATDATGPGFVTAWPSGSVPTVSNLNLDKVGQTSPNQITTPLADNGTLNFFTYAGTHVIVDVAGYYTK